MGKIATFCPLCNTYIPVKEGEDVNRKVNEHIEKGCPTTPTNVNRCSIKICQDISSLKIECEKCRKVYCVSHRHVQDHNCPSLNNVQSKSSNKNNKLVEAIEHIKKKYQPMMKDQNKFRNMNLMKMKMKAEGNANLEYEQRFYMEVIFPLDLKKESKYFFFNKEHSVGKVLDDITSKCRIKNTNNQINSPTLCMIDINSGNSLAFDKRLKELENIKSGDAILLEYKYDDLN